MGVEDLDEVDEKALQDRLADEGDYAADYLEELLDIADLDGDLEISSEADRASVAVVADDNSDRRLKRLIGRHGETLDALQELTRLAVQAKTGERSRLMLDVLGYRDGRRKAIQAIAREAVEQVQETGEDVALKPMNPFERKVVHDVVAAAGLFSDSTGVGPARHVVVSLPYDDDEDYEDEVLEDETIDSADEFEDSADEVDSADDVDEDGDERD